MPIRFRFRAHGDQSRLISRENALPDEFRLSRALSAHSLVPALRRGRIAFRHGQGQRSFCTQSLSSLGLSGLPCLVSGRYIEEPELKLCSATPSCRCLFPGRSSNRTIHRPPWEHCSWPCQSPSGALAYRRPYKLSPHALIASGGDIPSGKPGSRSYMPASPLLPVCRDSR